MKYNLAGVTSLVGSVHRQSMDQTIQSWESLLGPEVSKVPCFLTRLVDSRFGTVHGSFPGAIARGHPGLVLGPAGNNAVGQVRAR